MRRRDAPRASLDQVAGRAAWRVLAWSRARLESDQRAWLDALAAELDEIESGWEQLLWALGGPRLVWRGRRQAMSRVYRMSPAVLIVLGIALFGWLALSLARQYALLALVVGVLTVIGMLVVLPTLATLILLVKRLSRRQLDQQQVRRGWSGLAFVAGGLCAVALLGLGFSLDSAVGQMLAKGPATAGIVAGPSVRGSVEAALRQVPGMAQPDVYRTTLVKPLAVNGVPLAQLPQQ